MRLQQHLGAQFRLYSRLLKMIIIIIMYPTCQLEKALPSSIIMLLGTDFII